MRKIINAIAGTFFVLGIWRNSMLRKLGYILTSSLLLVGSIATMGKAISMMDTDVSYGNSKSLYFKISKQGTTYKGVDASNYLTSKDGYDPIDKIAEEMESRLENWDINAEVDKEGYDTIKVTVRTSSNDNTEYNYLEDYLSFSGQDITIAVGAPTDEIQKNAPSHTSYRNNNMFEGNTAAIEYVNNVPVVTIKVNETGENGELNELVKYCSENSTEANEESSIEASYCYVVLWNHYQEGDSYLAATNTSASDYDPNMAKRLIFGEGASNAWYVDTANENNNYTKFQLIPNSDAISNGNFDSTKAGAAYKAALYYCSIFNASKYDYDVTFDYATDVSPTIDSLISAKEWHLNVNFGPTMIAIIASVVIAAVILSLFFHLGALGIMTNAVLSIELGILIFSYFSAQFGIGALVGFILGGLVTIFGGAYYYAKTKEELYKGRSLKKAESEAAKKSLWPLLDVAIVAIVAGLCIYGFIPGTVGKMGLSLIWTSAFGTVLNLLLGRLLGWMLANDTSSEKAVGNTYFVDEKKIPDLLKEEKQTYFGPYGEKDFTKHKHVWEICAGVLTLASIVGVSVFGAMKTDTLNYSGAYENTTSIAIEYRVDSNSQATKTMATLDDCRDGLLNLIKYNDKTLYEYVLGDIVLEQTTISINDDSEIKKYNVYHFDVSLNTYFDENTRYKFTVNGTEEEEYLSVALEDAVSNNANADDITIRANRVVYQAGSPDLGTVYAAISVAAASLFVYYLLRFRLSRSLSSTLFALANSVIVTGFFALSRIAVTPTAAIAIIGAFLFTEILALYLFNKEKELIKDSREKNKESLAFRNASLLKANSQSAGDIIVFTLIGLGMVLPFIGIAPSIYRTMFLGLGIATLLALALVLTITSSTSVLASETLTKLKKSVRDSWNNRPRSEKSKATKKKNSEPEEATFIGIND